MKTRDTTRLPLRKVAKLLRDPDVKAFLTTDLIPINCCVYPIDKFWALQQLAHLEVCADREEVENGIFAEYVEEPAEGGTIEKCLYLGRIIDP